VDSELTAAERLAGELEEYATASCAFGHGVCPLVRFQDSASARPGHAEGVRIEWIRTPSRVLRADLEPGEVGDGDTGVLRDLVHGQLVVLGVVLLEQRDLLEERGHATLDDL